jgi:hypothetical protein
VLNFLKNDDKMFKYYKRLDDVLMFEKQFLFRFTPYDYTSNDNSNKLKHSFPNKIKRAYLVQCAYFFLIIFLEREITVCRRNYQMFWQFFMLPLENKWENYSDVHAYRYQKSNEWDAIMVDIYSNMWGTMLIDIKSQMNGTILYNNCLYDNSIFIIFK